MKLLMLLAASLLSFGCSTLEGTRVPLPPQDVEISSPQVTRIYVLDAPELSQGLHPVSVAESGITIGRVVAGNYLCWEREPGDCLIEVTFEDMDPMGDNVIELVDTTLDPGQVVYYALTLDPQSKRPKVRLLDRGEARELLKNLTSVQ